MMKMRRALRVVAALSICAALPLAYAGCKGSEEKNGTSSDGTKDTILVGEYGSMTGSEAAFGASTHAGIELAVDEINKAGGVEVGGVKKKIEVTTPEDTESNNQKAEIAVKRLLEKNVVAVLGEVASSRSRAGGAICQDKRVPMITPSSTNPSVTQVGDYIFRVCFIDPFQGGVIARFARNSLKANNAAILYDAGQTYSTGIRDEFTKAFTGMGGKIVGEQSYGQGDKDFRAQLTKLKSLNPDVIIVPGYYTEGGTICKQARDIGITVPLIGGDGWSDDKLLQYAGPTVSNVYFSDHASMEDKSEAIQNYVKAFRAKFGREPNSLSALGYDSMMVLADAMKRAKSLNGPDLRDAIAATKDFPGVTGSITINADRNVEKGAVIIEVKNGKFTFKESVPKS